MSRSPSISISEEQALWFRARRGHLSGPGAPDPVTAARTMVGIQAQQENPALLGISQRTAGRPEAAAILRMLQEPPRTLVRTWGQRDTLHIYDASNDWADVTAAQEQWVISGRRGGHPPEDLVEALRQQIHDTDALITKNDVYPLLSPEVIAEVGAKAADYGLDPARFVAGRFLWRLAQRGELCIAGKEGTERTMARRAIWFPELPWQDRDPVEAAARLTRRYLAVYGPATPADIASFFGARVSEVRVWLATMTESLSAIDCGGRKGLLALSEDLDALSTDPPSGSAWPLRLLPLWDGLLMGHKDKSWLVPEKPECKKIWRPGAFVMATVLERGRIVATWKQTPRKKALTVAIRPLSRWRPEFLDAVAAEADHIAGHLGLPAAVVKVES